MKRTHFTLRGDLARLHARLGNRPDRPASESPEGAPAEDARPKDGTGRQARLTVIMPTYNRPAHCAAQLRFFKNCGLQHDVLVADSSDADQAESVRAACAGVAAYRHFGPSIVDKFLAAVRAAETAFVVMVPDDDVTFPHALDGALAHLRENPDYVAAHGYTLRFGLHEDYVDIHRVCTFVPSIDPADPLERLFQLMRRYQAFFWAVFRRDVLISALEAARPYASMTMCQELAFMNTAVVQGKVAMLPMIYAMQGMEESKTKASSTHPLFACVDDAEQLFRTYLMYRNALARFIRARRLVADTRQFINPTSGAPSRLEQFIDVAHGSWLAHEANVGVFNHAAQILLGESKPLIRNEPVWSGWTEPQSADLVHTSAAGRKYVWRQRVLQAEPREEITISPAEIARVEAQLDGYRLG